MPWRCAMLHIAAGSTAPPRWTCSSVSSSPRGCGLRAARCARPGEAAPRSTSLLSRGWAPHSAAPPRCRGLALGVLGPDHVAVIVGRRDLRETVPHLGAAEILLGDLARLRALEHDVAVVGRAHHLPALLGEEVQEAGDLGEALRRVGHEFAEPP